MALLRIRPTLPDQEDVGSSRGPLHIESAIAALHSLRGQSGFISFEIGSYQGKICFFVRALRRALPIIESQLYAQYPDIDIEHIAITALEPKDGEVIFSTDLRLDKHEMYPIKRHPQFDDLLSRQNVDTIAGLTSALLRYPYPGMRGHIQLSFSPLSQSYRKRVLKFLPLMKRGLSKRFGWYAHLFATVHLARGWRWWIGLPLNIAMGGFRAWFSFLPSLSALLSDAVEQEDESSDEANKVSKRSHENEDALSAIVDKVNRFLFATTVRLSVVGTKDHEEAAIHKLAEMVSSFRQFSLPHCNGFQPTKEYQHQSFLSPVRVHPYALSVEEIATLWHFPNALVKTPNIDWVLSKKLEPPVDLPTYTADSTDSTVLGEAVFRGQRKTFGIKTDDRRRHLYAIGKTGMGKSTLLLNMIYSDVMAGRGVGVIDPHGDLIEAILRFIPSERTNDVVLFDPADREYPLSFNMLSAPHSDQYPLVVSGLMSVFTKLWPDVWSGRMEHILRNALLALIEGQGNSMLGILRMFSDDHFRTKIVTHTQDRLVRSFWEDEYAQWSEKYRTEAIAAIQNKIGQLLSVPIIRNIVGQVTSKLSIREAMDTGKIVLVNLSKGNIGEDNSAFLGSMLVTKFQLDAMSRADIQESQRKDFFLYVDEFQNFATESFATILSEARKYRLSLTLAHQYVGQLLIGDKSTALRDAVFGNVGSMVSFQIGSEDAELFSEQFEEMVQPKDILSLPKYHAYLRLMIHGMPSKPFSISTLAPPHVVADERRLETIRRTSRERYCEKRSIVEGKINAWLESAKEARNSLKKVEKTKEKEAEENEKARKKGMKLVEYRAWRDREMWTNDFNALRKKSILESLTEEERQKMSELQQKLEQSGGVPAPSKAINEALMRKGGNGQVARDTL